MVVGTIIQGIYQTARIAIKAYSRYNKYERKLFNFAYRGYPARVRRGAIHGHIVGQIAGNFINQGEEEFDDGFQQTTELPSSRPYDKTYRRPTRRSSSSYKRNSRFNRGCSKPNACQCQRCRNR